MIFWISCAFAFNNSNNSNLAHLNKLKEMAHHYSLESLDSIQYCYGAIYKQQQQQDAQAD